MVNGMNSGHAEVSDWGMGFLKIEVPTEVVEVGCGGGRNVAQLLFADEQFDLATAFETVYFWPGPADSFREVYRVLRLGGTFLIVNESDGTNQADEKWTVSSNQKDR